MDVVALAQHGVDYAVATLGTATTPVHVQKLFRLTDTRRVLLRRRQRGAQGGVARARKRAAGAGRRQERRLPVPARRRGSGRLRAPARQGGVRGADRAARRRCRSSCSPSCRRAIRRRPPKAARRSSRRRARYLAQLTAPMLVGAVAAAAGRTHGPARDRAARAAAVGPEPRDRRRGSDGAGDDDGGPQRRAAPGKTSPRRAPSLVRELIQALLLQPELARTVALPHADDGTAEGAALAALVAVLHAE